MKRKALNVGRIVYIPSLKKYGVVNTTRNTRGEITVTTEDGIILILEKLVRTLSTIKLLWLAIKSLFVKNV